MAAAPLPEDQATAPAAERQTNEAAEGRAPAPEQSLNAAAEDQAPPRHLLMLEWVTVFGRFWRAFGRIGERGPPDGPPVLVIPGFFASDRSTLGLQRALARAGYRVTGWGMGLNRGAHVGILDEIVDRLERFSGGRPAILVGWSLGGVFAREVAKLRPDLVAHIFTLGSPFSGDPRANNAWRLYEKIAGHPVDRPPLAVEVGIKPPVPTIAIWSRRDGMVAPACARGTEEQSDLQIHVDCRHMGFTTSGRGIRQVVSLVQRHGRTAP